MKKTNLCIILISLSILPCLGCSSKHQVQRVQKEVIIEKSYVISDPGAVEFVWEPPMIDVVDVPPGLDPEGHYYRPSHQEIMEIRPGRWQYYNKNKNN